MDEEVGFSFSSYSIRLIVMTSHFLTEIEVSITLGEFDRYERNPS